jgi:hypothetical protein
VPRAERYAPHTVQALHNHIHSWYSLQHSTGAVPLLDECEKSIGTSIRCQKVTVIVAEPDLGSGVFFIPCIRDNSIFGCATLLTIIRVQRYRVQCISYQYRYLFVFKLAGDMIVL